jgi:hypothetical protein
MTIFQVRYEGDEGYYTAGTFGDEATANAVATKLQRLAKLADTTDDWTVARLRFVPAGEPVDLDDPERLLGFLADDDPYEVTGEIEAYLREIAEPEEGDAVPDPEIVAFAKRFAEQEAARTAELRAKQAAERAARAV